MAGEEQRALPPEGLSGAGVRVGIVRSRWNLDIVDRLHDGARRGLRALGVTDADVIEETVPGSFELPMGARVLATSGRVDAIICLGCVIRGETTHYEIVGESAAGGIQQVQLNTGIPVAFGVLTVEDMNQAMDRSQGPGGHNVGEDSAIVAVEMARLAQRHVRT
jgi:6,7-dimethyl-8-ribityllumazine synthase